jgi:hypothetical protein
VNKMKTLIISLAWITGTYAHAADSYYCKLENVPVVKTALQAALTQVNAPADDANGEPKQFTISGMGDAYDFWGTDMLVYSLSNLANDNRLSVAVKVTYTSLMAKAYVEDEIAAGVEPENFVCGDTGEVNPEKIYIDSDDIKIEAKPVLL